MQTLYKPTQVACQVGTRTNRSWNPYYISSPGGADRRDIPSHVAGEEQLSVLLETANISVGIDNLEKWLFSRYCQPKLHCAIIMSCVSVVPGQVQQELEPLSRIAGSLRGVRPLTGAETGTQFRLPRSVPVRYCGGCAEVQLDRCRSNWVGNINGPNSTSKPSGPTGCAKLSGLG